MDEYQSSRLNEIGLNFILKFWQLSIMLLTKRANYV